MKNRSWARPGRVPRMEPALAGSHPMPTPSLDILLRSCSCKVAARHSDPKLPRSVESSTVAFTTINSLPRRQRPPAAQLQRNQRLERNNSWIILLTADLFYSLLDCQVGQARERQT